MKLPDLIKAQNSLSSFSIWVEETVLNNPDYTYIQVILEYCEQCGVDYIDAANLISPSLKQKILEEARKEFSMPKQEHVEIQFEEYE